MRTVSWSPKLSPQLSGDTRRTPRFTGSRFQMRCHRRRSAYALPDFCLTRDSYSDRPGDSYGDTWTTAKATP